MRTARENLAKEYEDQNALHHSITKWFEDARDFCQTYPDHKLQRVADIHLLLDRHLRCRMFHIAARYWEGRWLDEMETVFEKKEKLGGQAQSVVECRFRRWAMLTPCFVSTMHMAPHIFSYFDGQEQRLFDFIDMFTGVPTLIE